MGAVGLARPGRGWPARLAALALAVGLVFSFPHWVWLYASPDYSILRGYILSDDDFAPYSAALSDAASRPFPPVTAYNRAYEARQQFSPAALSNWLTHFLWGAVLRLAGSLELFVPVALFVSGAAAFLALVALARRFIAAPAGALLVAGLCLFRYPFYISLIAAVRRAVAGGDPAAWLRAAFPGMVNGYMLYPYVRWTVPGLVFAGFVLALILLAALLRRDWLEPGRPGLRWAVLGAGAGLGLTAYLYFFFWSYLAVFLGLLIFTAWLMGRRRLAGTLVVVGLIAGAISAPFWLTAGGLVRTGAPAVTHLPAEVSEDYVWAPLPQPPLETLLVALSTHGLLALAVLFSPGLAPTSAASPGLGWERVYLFCLHLSVVLLAAIEATGFRALQAWHWSKHLIDCLAPLTAGWLIARRMGQPAARPARWMFGVAGLWAALAVFVAAAIAGQPALAGGPEAAARTLVALALAGPGLAALPLLRGRRPAVAGAAAVTAVTWYLFHRTVSEMSWLAFLPLGWWAAGTRPRPVAAAATALVGLNVALALVLQLAVRPIYARPFFSQPPQITEALRWLDANSPPESVVTTNSWLGDSLIRGYTHNLTLAVPGWWTTASPAERAARLWVRSAIYDESPEQVRALAAVRSETAREFKAKVNDEWIGDDRLGFLTEQQAGFPYDPEAYAALAAQPLAELLTIFRVDYIWVGPWEASVGRRSFDATPLLTLVYQNDLVRIYAVDRAARP